MKRLDLKEGRNEVAVSVPESVAAAVSRLGLANLLPLGGGDWSVSDVSKVGVIHVDGWQVAIAPKIPVARLFFMIGFSSDQKFWRDEHVTIGSDVTVLDAIARSFIRQVGIAMSRGKHQAYETFGDALPVIRGRLDVPAQLGRRAGLALPAQVIFDEYTVDTAENQLLLSASLRLLALPSLSSSNRMAVKKLTQQFEGVTPIGAGRSLPSVRFHRLNIRYEGAVGLSTLILRNCSLEHRQGDYAASGFLLDTWRIFEDFVSEALRASLSRYGTGISVELQSSSYLDRGRELIIKPDILLRSNGIVRAAIDAKYKAEKLGRYPNADVYQMLAYCIKFGLSEGHLVYARGDADVRSYVIDRPGITIYCHALNLDQPPDALMAEVDALAARIAEPIPVGGGARS